MSEKVEMVGGFSMTHEQIRKRLADLGYFKQLGVRDEEVAQIDAGSTVMTEATISYQRLAGLDDDGDPLEITQYHMLLPRCGNPDFVLQDASQLRWPANCLTVPTTHRLSRLTGVEANLIDQAWLESLSQWRAACGLNPTWVDKVEDAKCIAVPNRLPRGVLANAYQPYNQCNITLDSNYNTIVVWTYELLLETILHEMGHWWGLGHLGPGSIMAATASGSLGGKLQAADKHAIQAIYGPNVDPLPPPTPEPPGPGFEPLGEYEGWVRRKAA